MKTLFRWFIQGGGGAIWVPFFAPSLHFYNMFCVFMNANRNFFFKAIPLFLYYPSFTSGKNLGVFSPLSIFSSSVGSILLLHKHTKNYIGRGSLSNHSGKNNQYKPKLCALMGSTNTAKGQNILLLNFFLLLGTPLNRVRFVKIFLKRKVVLCFELEAHCTQTVFFRGNNFVSSFSPIRGFRLVSKLPFKKFFFFFFPGSL